MAEIATRPRSPLKSCLLEDVRRGIGRDRNGEDISFSRKKQQHHIVRIYEGNTKSCR
jgi:hypothetical protein